MPFPTRTTHPLCALLVAAGATLAGLAPAWAAGEEPAGGNGAAEAAPVAQAEGAGSSEAPAKAEPAASETAADPGTGAAGTADAAAAPAAKAEPAAPETAADPVTGAAAEPPAAPATAAKAEPAASEAPAAAGPGAASAEPAPAAAAKAEPAPAAGSGADGAPAAPIQFRSTAEFAAALKAHLPAQGGIARLCEALGLSAGSLEPKGASAAQEKLLEQARTVANLGPCLDEALVAARGLAQGQDRGRILADIRRRREELALFHGLSQGPAQDRIGPEKTLKATFRHYGMDGLAQVRPVTVALSLDPGSRMRDPGDAGTGKADLQRLLEGAKDRIFLANLREAGGAGHYLTVRVDPAGTGMLVYDAEWSEVPLEQAYDVLRNYADLTGNPRPYVAVDFYPVP